MQSSSNASDGEKRSLAMLAGTSVFYNPASTDMIHHFLETTYPPRTKDRKSKSPRWVRESDLKMDFVPGNKPQWGQGSCILVSDSGIEVWKTGAVTSGKAEAVRRSDHPNQRKDKEAPRSDPWKGPNWRRCQLVSWHKWRSSQADLFGCMSSSWFDSIF